MSCHRRATTEVIAEAVALAVDLSPVPDIENHYEDGMRYGQTAELFLNAMPHSPETVPPPR